LRASRSQIIKVHGAQELSNERLSWEGGVTEQNGGCAIEFTFVDDTVQIVEAGGNCRSFYGAGGSLNAVLKRIVEWWRRPRPSARTHPIAAMSYDVPISAANSLGRTCSTM
jgi:hypothetical protein